jgi:hypothetical protein
VTGLSVLDFLTLGFVLWMKMSCGELTPLFDPARLVRDDVALLHGNRVAAFFKLTATDYAGFRAECVQHPPTRAALELFAYNPLSAYPIIQTQVSGYAMPLPPALLHRISTGLYYDHAAIFGEKFCVAFGDAFERYVGRLLEERYSTSELFHEPPYGSKKHRSRSTDWIIVEGGVAILLECKATRLTMPTKVSGDAELLKEDLVKGLVKALMQLHKVRDGIFAKAQGLEMFAGITDVIPVILLYDAMYLANTPYIREIVEGEIRQRGIEPFEYQVISVYELERTLPAIQRVGLADLLRKKMADDKLRWHSSKFVDFITYLDNTAGVHLGHANALSRAWQRLGDHLADQFPEAHGWPVGDLLADRLA